MSNILYLLLLTIISDDVQAFVKILSSHNDQNIANRQLKK